MSNEVAITQYWLTTSDNPYDPFTQFDEWYAYDTSQGYNTCSYLGRMVKQAPNLDGEVNDAIANDAIDRIIELDVIGKYTKVSRDGSLD